MTDTRAPAFSLNELSTNPRMSKGEDLNVEFSGSGEKTKRIPSRVLMAQPIP